MLETNTLKPNNLCKFQNNVAQYIDLRFLNIYCFTAFNKKSTMKSIVLYGKLREGANDTNDYCTEMHVNIWKVRKSKHLCIKENIYFDFGIKFHACFDNICLYLPFEIKDKKVYDLGETLSSDDSLLSAVFNESMRSQSAENACFTKIHYREDQDDKSDFYLYKIGQQNVTVRDFIEEGKTKPSGNYVNIEMIGCPNEPLCSKKEYYIRFRVEAKDKADVAKSMHVSNNLLQAAFSMTDIYDLRINESREIDVKVKEDMVDQKHYIQCIFNKVHVFYMAEAKEHIDNRSTISLDSRILETKLWEKYEPKTNVDNIVYIANHWKKRKKGEEDIKKFSLFFSTIYPKVYLFRLMVYCATVILLGWMGSMLCFGFWDVVEGNVPYRKLAIIIILVLLITGYIIYLNMVAKFFLRRKA